MTNETVSPTQFQCVDDRINYATLFFQSVIALCFWHHVFPSI